MNPSVLVGIVTHNRAEILPRAIDSALAQKGCNMRVSVIDDGSTDETSKLSDRYPQVEWIHWNPGRGYMTARNHWMRQSKIDYFVSLDDDSWFLRDDEMATAVNFLERHENVAAVAYDVLDPDHPEPVERACPRCAAMFIGCGHVLKLRALESIGYYDPVPGSYGGEEKDLCIRLIDAGLEVILLPGVHIWHDKTMVARDLADQYRSVVCNDLVMMARRTPAWMLPVILPHKLIRHALHSLRKGMMGPCASGFLLAASAMPSALKARAPVAAKSYMTFMRRSRGDLPVFPDQEFAASEQGRDAIVPSRPPPDHG